LRQDFKIVLCPFTIITKLYDFILWPIPKLEKFPRSQKFLLAEWIENGMRDILELFIEAAYSKKKGSVLCEESLKLETLRYPIRLSKDLKSINIKDDGFSAGAMIITFV